jgi:hypothetical protein
VVSEYGEIEHLDDREIITRSAVCAASVIELWRYI